ncbi:conserved exported hypothetical protein [Luteimonas sp. 9C]|uniref:hypothetical protein n=1 Tax=Luteimonas sp. 9C TaxID=2653148 RepID=UPI0012F0AC71|nr:hypothetical protein [Luteimonas sp. 9C]VXB18447.1 conserved exported hypothetical protein [Luteimonas sp. 9C]
MRHVAALALFSLTLAACDAAPTAAAPVAPVPAVDTRAPAPAETPPSAAAAHDLAAAADGDVVVSAQSVWQGDPAACRTGTAAVDDCLLSAMRAGGASPDALAASSRLIALGNPGYVSAWREIEGVGHAEITYPFRANTNQGLWLVDGDGRAVDVDENVLPAGAVRLRGELKPFLDAHPDAMPFAPAQAVGSEALPEGGVRLRFDVPMRTCHACADVGVLELGYDFSADRRFEGRSVIALREAD